MADVSGRALRHRAGPTFVVMLVGRLIQQRDRADGDRMESTALEETRR